METLSFYCPFSPFPDLLKNNMSVIFYHKNDKIRLSIKNVFLQFEESPLDLFM